MPHVGVAFTSDYSLNEVPGDRDLGADAMLLQKPFGVRNLLDAVCRALDEDAPPAGRE